MGGAATSTVGEPAAVPERAGLPVELRAASALGPPLGCARTSVLPHAAKHNASAAAAPLALVSPKLARITS